MPALDAIILAGGIPIPDDPIYAHSQGRHKSLIDIGGKPMVQWVIDALDQSSNVSRLTVIGLDQESQLLATKPLSYLPDSGGILENVLAGLEHLSQTDSTATHALIASADIPGLTSEMIDWRVEVAMEAPKDVDYVVVDRATMESRFPDSNRSYVRLRDYEVCGGDINVVRVGLTQDAEIWGKIIGARKSVFKQASLIGYSTLALLLAGRLGLESALDRVTSRLGISGNVHLSPYAEVAMDIDKPHQFEILRRDLTAGVEGQA
jgi:molybdopterin-guanine dinucleotide biosynthesis protein A